MIKFKMAALYVHHHTEYTDPSDLIAVSGEKGETCVNCFGGTSPIPGPPGPPGQPGFPGNTT